MSNESSLMQLSDAEWRERLTPEEFQVCRQKGTERAFSGEYCDTKEAGIYSCRCCGEALFDASSKYDSGSGWPSFYQPSNSDAIVEHRDISHGMIRVEVLCQRCHAHLGHVFNDGPKPTGLRYCINSLSLRHKRSDM